MSEIMSRISSPRAQKIELSNAERTQLNVFIDLLIPSDKDFPPPSSLHLIDVLLSHLSTNKLDKISLLSEKRLRSALRDLNMLAGGSFCGASRERQHSTMRNFAHHEPALFQTIWTLVSHSYYSCLAMRKQPTPALT